MSSPLVPSSPSPSLFLNLTLSPIAKAAGGPKSAPQKSIEKLFLASRACSEQISRQSGLPAVARTATHSPFSFRQKKIYTVWIDGSWQRGSQRFRVEIPEDALHISKRNLEKDAPLQKSDLHPGFLKTRSNQSWVKISWVRAIVLSVKEVIVAKAGS